MMVVVVVVVVMLGSLFSFLLGALNKVKYPLHLQIYNASIPVLKVLLITALGSFLALDRIDILGESARKHVNEIAFFVFNPALIVSNLAATITLKSIVKLWFMPINVLLTFIIGSVLGWILVMVTKAPPHLKGLVIGSCSAGNLGNLLLIIIPAVCKEKNSPFGNPHVCHDNGMAYASLSLALGAIFLWSYTYNIVRVFSNKAREVGNKDDANVNIISVVETSSGEVHIKSIVETTEQVHENSTDRQSPVDIAFELTLPSNNVKEAVKHVTISEKMKHHFSKFSRQINVKAVFAPSTIGALIGFAIGTISPVQKLMIGDTALLRVIHDSADLLGNASIPAITLVMGGNLLRGLRGSGIQLSLIVGIITIRYVFLPVLGIIIIKKAIHVGLVHSDPLYQFVLLLQFALPPALNLGTITQLFEAGESECSVIMLWTYILAAVSLTLWSTCFMWLVS